MTIAELGFRFILTNAQDDFVGTKISRTNLSPLDVEDVKGFLGKRYSLSDAISEKTYILDLTQAKIEKNELVFAGAKPNFYRA
jgi:hypothetical protein